MVEQIYPPPIALISETAAEEDALCILLGCDAPVVLHSVEEYYTLLGDTYVPYMMQGEILKEVETCFLTSVCFCSHYSYNADYTPANSLGALMQSKLTEQDQTASDENFELILH